MNQIDPNIDRANNLDKFSIEGGTASFCNCLRVLIRIGRTGTVDRLLIT